MMDTNPISTGLISREDLIVNAHSHFMHSIIKKKKLIYILEPENY
jgi:hypothetical protein